MLVGRILDAMHSRKYQLIPPFGTALLVAFYLTIIDNITYYCPIYLTVLF